MGLSKNPLFESLKGMVHGDNKEEIPRDKARVFYRKNVVLRCKRPRRILMKRRARLEGSRRNSGRRGVQRRVRTLKRLVPKSSACTGLDGLFRETADYILSLQMKVKVMQVMVKALTGSDE